MNTYPFCLTQPHITEKVRASKVLCVGAGGIGCELLKTLVMTGFRDIEVIDLDTIDTSNLNRQFLFRKRHVGQYKSEVAAEAVRSFCPEASIKCYTGRVQEPQYGPDFYKRFAVVLNGLDNLDARKHVNRMCVAATVPLVESGTAGYAGQTSVHLPAQTACYECEPKSAPKTFAVCTIRATPEKPIHCVVWAKELFAGLFGPAEALAELADSGAGERGQETQAEASVSGSQFLRREGESPSAYAQRIFDVLYGDRIARLLAMKGEDYWQNKLKPTPLFLRDVFPTGVPPAPGPAAAPTAAKRLGLDTHVIWNLQQNASVFLEATRMFLETRAEELGALVFDKDDALAVDFVTAASNLRALGYGIPTQSVFDCKGMAGNIIHAIATTNAAISGLIAVEAVKIVCQLDHATLRQSYLIPGADTSRVGAAAPDKLNPACLVCGRSSLTLYVDTLKTTLRDVVEKVAKGRLAVTKVVVNGAASLMYDEGEDDEELAPLFAANLLKPLASLPGGGLGHGATFTIQDELQEFNVQIVVQHKDDWNELEVPEGFLLEGSADKSHAKAAAAAAAAADGEAAAAVAVEDADGVVVVEDGEDVAVVDEAEAQGAGTKRKAVEGAAEGPDGKKARTEA